MPPPTISWSTFCARLFRIVSLVETFEPATIATSGRFGLPSARVSASISAASSGPAQAIGANFAMPCVVASARCAVPNASFTYTSASRAIFCASSSEFFFSPLLTRQFSSSTNWPGWTCTPSTQFATSGTVATEQFAEALRHRRERVLRLELAFGGTAEVRRDHHRRAGVERHADRRHGGADARVLGDVARVVLRNVEVGTDEDTAAGELAAGGQLSEGIDAHGRRELSWRTARCARCRSEVGIIRAASRRTPVRTLRLSPPERAAIAVAIALLALHAFAPGDALEYQRGALARQPWRVLTGHLVHINWPHALINAAALWIVARLYAPDLSATRQAIALAASALAISAALAWLYPAIEWYRGLSGALHGLFFAGAAKWLLTERPRSLRRLWLPAAALRRRMGRRWCSSSRSRRLPHADWLGAAVVPQAHLAGAACGTVLGALFAATQARGGEQRDEQ